MIWSLAISYKIIMEKELFNLGLSIRKEVLGEEYVNNSIQNMNEFNTDLQKLITEYCWGQIWSREGLSRTNRSMINIAMLTALNRPNELKLHIRGALNNGVEREEIKEILLQTAIYCGVPASLDSFKVAIEVFKSIDEEKNENVK